MYPPTTAQPQPMGNAPVNQRLWSSGTFSCFDDFSSCIIGALCPIVLACKVSMNMEESACVPLCVPGASIVMRTKMRTQHNIQGSIMDDCLMTTCCGPCILCQMSRELDYVKRVGTYPS